MNYGEFKRYIKHKAKSKSESEKAVSALNQFMDFKQKSETHRIGKDLIGWSDEEKELFRTYLTDTKGMERDSAKSVLSYFKVAHRFYHENESIDQLLESGVFLDCILFRMRQLNISKEQLYIKLGIPNSKRSKPDKWFGPVVDPKNIENFKSGYKRNIPFAEDPYVKKLQEILGFDSGDEAVPGDLAAILPTRFHLADTAQGLHSYDTYRIRWEELRAENPLLADQIELYCEYKVVAEIDLYIPYLKTYCSKTNRLIANPNPPKHKDTGNRVQMTRNFRWEIKDDLCVTRTDRIRQLMAFAGFLVNYKKIKIKDLNILQFINQDLAKEYRVFLLDRMYPTPEAKAELRAQYTAKSAFDKVATRGWVAYMISLVDLCAKDGGFLRQRRDIIQDEIVPVIEHEFYEAASTRGKEPVYRKVVKMVPIPAGEKWEKFILQENEKLRNLVDNYTNLVSRRIPKKKKLQEILALDRPEIVHLEIIARVNRELEIFQKNRVYNEWVLCLLRDRMLYAAAVNFGQRAGSVTSTKLSHHSKIIGQGSDFYINDLDEQIWIFLPAPRQKNNKDFRRKIDGLFPLKSYIEDYLEYAHAWFKSKQPDRKHRLIFSPYGSLTADEALVEMEERQREESLLNGKGFDRDSLRKAIVNLSKNFGEFEVPISTHDIRTIQKETADKWARENGISVELANKFSAFMILDSDEIAKEYYSEESFNTAQRDLDRMWGDVRARFMNEKPDLAKYLNYPIEKSSSKVKKESKRLIQTPANIGATNASQIPKAAAAFWKSLGPTVNNLSVEDLLLEMELSDLSEQDRELVFKLYGRKKVV